MRELTAIDIQAVNGGINPIGIGLIGLGIAVAAGTGIAALPIGLAFGVSFLASSVSVGLAGAGGFVAASDRERC